MTINNELPQDHPLKSAAGMPNPERDRPVTAVAEPDWKSEAQRLDAEVRFWKAKYFEALQNSQSQAQVIAMLARPQIERDARQQAEMLSKLVGGMGIS